MLLDLNMHWFGSSGDLRYHGGRLLRGCSAYRHSGSDAVEKTHLVTPPMLASGATAVTLFCLTTDAARISDVSDRLL